MTGLGLGGTGLGFGLVILTGLGLRGTGLGFGLVILTGFGLGGAGFGFGGAGAGGATDVLGAII